MKQRELYRAMRPPAGEAGSAAPSVAPDASAAAAAEAEAGSLRDELAGVREQAAETEAAFAAQLARAQEAERVALQAKAAACLLYTSPSPRDRG